MNNSILIWFLISLLLLSVGVWCVVTQKNKVLLVIGTYFIAQPFAWTLFSAASMGGGVLLPIPDSAAIIYLLFSGDKYGMGPYGGVATMPPPFVSSVVVYFVVMFIVRRAKQANQVILPQKHLVSRKEKEQPL